MRFKTAIILSLFPILCGMALSAAETTPTLAQFDDEVAQCRRLLRQYCAITLNLMTQKNPSDKLRDEALGYLRDAKARWVAIRAKYQDLPPAEYRADREFKGRLTDILDAFGDMETHLLAGRAKRSSQACGFACGLFVAMHEQNNLVYALDRLYHLRNLTKTAIAATQAGGPASLREILPELMHRRDRVLLAPCPWPDDQDRANAYENSLRRLSATVDQIAINLGGREQQNPSKNLRELLDAIQEAYVMAL